MARTIEIKGTNPNCSLEGMNSVLCAVFQELLSIENEGEIIKSLKVEVETIDDEFISHTSGTHIHIGTIDSSKSELSPYGKLIDFLESNLDKKLNISFLLKLSDLYIDAIGSNPKNKYEVCRLEEINQFLKENKCRYRVISKTVHKYNTPYGSEQAYCVITV